MIICVCYLRVLECQFHCNWQANWKPICFRY